MRIGKFTNVSLRKTSAHDADFKFLNSKLNEYLGQVIYGADKKQAFEPIFKAKAMDFVLILYVNNRAVGCCSYRKLDSKTAEIKKIFLRDGYRGKQLSKLMLNELISHCKDAGFERLLLETRSVLKASISLAKSVGFVQIPCYPPYETIPDAVCMELSIS